MHRLILGLVFGDKLQVDHRNHDTLDNRRSNIQIVTRRKNHENRKDQSKYGVGIAFDKRNKTKPFQVYVKINSKRIYVGNFSTTTEAQIARKIFLKRKTK